MLYTYRFTFRKVPITGTIKKMSSKLNAVMLAILVVIYSKLPKLEMPFKK